MLNVYGLPVAYAGKTYNDTGLTKAKAKEIEGKITKAPSKGTLTINGTAAPIVNQFINDGRKVRGVDFTVINSKAFEEFSLPVSSVVLLYNVGVEVSTNFKISGQVFRKILKFYSEKNTLLIIETDLTKTELLSRYDFRVTNFIKIPQKEEEIWV